MLAIGPIKPIHRPYNFALKNEPFILLARQEDWLDIWNSDEFIEACETIRWPHLYNRGSKWLSVWRGFSVGERLNKIKWIMIDQCEREHGIGSPAAEAAWDARAANIDRVPLYSLDWLRAAFANVVTIDGEDRYRVERYLSRNLTDDEIETRRAEFFERHDRPEWMCAHGWYCHQHTGKRREPSIEVCAARDAKRETARAALAAKRAATHMEYLAECRALVPAFLEQLKGPPNTETLAEDAAWEAVIEKRRRAALTEILQSYEAREIELNAEDVDGPRAVVPLDPKWWRPDGLLGEIADWIVDNATTRPNRPLAVAAATVIVGTAIGRTLAGPTRSASHLYVACLGESAIGKEWPMTAIRLIMNESGLACCLQGGKWKSDVALEGSIASAPAQIAIIDEIGASLFSTIMGRNAGSHSRGISEILRVQWGSNFGCIQTSKSAVRKSETVWSPALSIYGASTIDEFYSSLTGDAKENGFLNRFR